MDFDLLNYVQRTVLMGLKGTIQQVHTQLDESEGSYKYAYSWMLGEGGVSHLIGK